MDTSVHPRNHNNPPPYDPERLDAEKQAASEFNDEAAAWLDAGEIESEEDAQKLADVIAKARKVRSQIDGTRKAEKKPHDDAAKAVQAAFAPLIDSIDRTGKRLKTMMTVYMERKEREQREEAARKAEEARRQREEAERQAAQAAARNDSMGETEAEAARKAAEKAAKEAEKAATQNVNVGSATGAGRGVAMRTQKVARVTNMNLAFMHFRDRPEVRELLERLATAEARAGNEVPGVEITEKRTAA